jgi:uncharacterized protein
MRIALTRFWAIADTHLSFAKERDLTRFGEKWLNHTDRISEAWKAQIQPDDVVLLPGDVSWAQSPGRIWPDLHWLEALPGRKVLLRGNHDHWWRDVYKVRKIVEPMGFYALEGDSIVLDGVIICGAMGHIAPHDPYYTENARKDRYNRELKRLESALSDSASKRQADQPLILMMHYPPFTSQGGPTAYVDLISHYKPTLCLYGHLHKHAEWEVARHGMYEGVHYQLVASDYLEMRPLLVWPLNQSIESQSESELIGKLAVLASTSPSEQE